MDLLDLDLEEIVPLIAISAAQASMDTKTPQRTGQSGSDYLEELLNSTPKRIYEVLRMQRETFYSLCRWLEDNTTLRSTWRTSIEEQVAMFLWTMNFSASNRQVCERFQHSGETVSRLVTTVYTN